MEVVKQNVSLTYRFLDSMYLITDVYGWGLPNVFVLTLDFYELKMMMEKLGQPKTHLELKKMIAQVDKSGTGTLSYREFVEMMLGPRSAIFK